MVDVGSRVAFCPPFVSFARGRGFAALDPAIEDNESRPRTEDTSPVSDQERQAT